MIRCVRRCTRRRITVKNASPCPNATTRSSTPITGRVSGLSSPTPSRFASPTPRWFALSSPSGNYQLFYQKLFLFLFSFSFSGGNIIELCSIRCGYDQQDAGAASPTDGILGLGSGQASIMSQLRDQGITRNVIGHCLSRRGGGYLYFGDNLIPPYGVTWAPMSSITSR